MSLPLTVTDGLIERLSRYRAVIRRLKALGLVRVFSNNLGDVAGVSAAQVRKDFQAINLRGVRRGGYCIEELSARLDELLGSAGPMRAVVIGCGHIGAALLSKYGYAHDGVSVVAGFDVDPAVIDPTAEPPVLPGRDLPGYIRENGVKVAIIAVPEHAAASVAEQLRGTGIRGVLNFTPVPLRDTDTWIVHNIDIRMEIEKLFHRIAFHDRNPPLQIDA